MQLTDILFHSGLDRIVLWSRSDPFQLLGPNGGGKVWPCGQFDGVSGYFIGSSGPLSLHARDSRDADGPHAAEATFQQLRVHQTRDGRQFVRLHRLLFCFFNPLAPRKKKMHTRPHAIIFPPSCVYYYY